MSRKTGRGRPAPRHEQHPVPVLQVTGSGSDVDRDPSLAWHALRLALQLLAAGPAEDGPARDGAR